MTTPKPNSRKSTIVLGLLLAAATAGWSATSEARPKLANKTAHGLYQTSYQNLSLAGDSSQGVGPVALIAGSHEPNFPYWGTEAWDNGLLLFDGEGYHFTHRTQGQALELIFDVNPHYGWIYYRGQMVRASDDELVEAKLYFTVKLVDK